MDNKSGGQLSSAQKQQQTAAYLARQKVLEAYERQAYQRQEKTVRGTSAPKPTATDTKKKKRLLGRAAAKAFKNTKKAQAKTAPMNVSSEDWRKYHSAWQDYYQKYYGEYYQKAARDYVAKERLKIERSAAEKAEKDSLAKAASTRDENNFKAQIQDKVAKRAKKMRKSRHFIPIIVGLSVLILGLLFQYNQVIIANAVAFMSPGGSEVNDITAIDPTVSTNVHENPTLMIPKLNVEVPVTFGANNDVKSMAAAMTNGVAHYSISGASAIPGEIGNFAVSGHSAGNVYETSQYKFIFSGLTRLTNGDLIYMDYNGTRYSYRVTGTNTVEPSDSAALRRIANENPGKPMITLITCTPLGTSKYRLLVYGEQIHPSVNDDTATQAPAKESDSDTQTMPKNSDSPLEQFWKWLTGQE
jgi:sortase A